MRHPRFFSTMIVTGAFLVVGTFAPSSVPAQAPKKEAPAKKDAQKKEAPPKPGPYQTVAVTPPTPINDPSLEAFRKQLAGVAQKKDRAALAQLVAASFFWMQDDKDAADKGKPAADNLAKAIGLEGKSTIGWEVILDYAAETTAAPDPQRQGVVCAPAQPTVDEKALEELVKATRLAAWLYPVRDGVEVRSGPQPKAAVIEKLGLHLVRPLEPPTGAGAGAVGKIVTPSGKTGYVSADAVREIDGPQMCFIKDAGGWKIAGFLGTI